MTRIESDFRSNMTAIIRSSLPLLQKKVILARLAHQIELLCRAFPADSPSSQQLLPQEREELQKLLREMTKAITSLDHSDSLD